MDCTASLTTQKFQSYLEELGFTISTHSPPTGPSQDLYWVPHIPAYTHEDIIRKSPDGPTAEMGINLRQQHTPGQVRVSCQTCLGATTFSLPGTLHPPASTPNPQAPAVHFHMSNADIIKLIQHTPFSAQVGTVLNQTDRNWHTFSVKDCCHPSHTMTLHLMEDGSHEARCPDCDPHHPAGAFINTFRIGLLMATETDVTLLTPADRSTHPHQVPDPTRAGPTPTQYHKEHPGFSPTITNLSRVLSALNNTDLNKTVPQRVDAQWAIYLAQAIGVNLHYDFHYTAYGPFCRDLTADHHTLNEQPREHRQEIAQRKLREPFASALTTVRHLIHDQRHPATGTSDWLQILSSVHYLRRIAELDDAAAQAKIEADQPLLAGYADAATKALSANNML